MLNIRSDEHLSGTKRLIISVLLNEETQQDIAIARVSAGVFKAFEIRCPHSGGPLHLGDIEDIQGHLSITCPWHEFRFSLEDGRGESPCEAYSMAVYQVKQTDFGFTIDIPGHSRFLDMRLIDITVNTSHSNIKHDPAISLQVTKTLSDWAYLILITADPQEKVRLTNHVSHLWTTGQIEHVGTTKPPAHPARDNTLTTVHASQTKRRGKAGSEESRIAIMHSLANIEQWAIDLAWDIIIRFTNYNSQELSQFSNSVLPCSQIDLPRQYFTDFIKVATDEAKHFSLLEGQLKRMGSYFGALSVHQGLWESASETSHDLLARLAIVHMVHEARGLDVNPTTIANFKKANDQESADVLTTIHNDEITHVTCGQKWFTFILTQFGLEEDRYSIFHSIVRRHFKGLLKPPFNTIDRLNAGLDEQYYLPLSFALPSTLEKQN